MKITDLALIFVAIFLPIVVITYVNTSFVVKAEKQEMYYKNVINSAVIDAVSSMKHIESDNKGIDYGYSGIVDNKVSINPNIAISTFYNSLSNNYNIKDNEMSLQKLKLYIPVIAVLDYDGIYIHSAEHTEDGHIKFITKPKINYTYTYIIKKTSSILDDKNEYEILEYDKIQNTSEVLGSYIYQVTFTMDDYIYLDVYNIAENGMVKMTSDKFYLSDDGNNENLIYRKRTYEIIEETVIVDNNVTEEYNATVDSNSGEDEEDTFIDDTGEGGVTDEQIEIEENRTQIEHIEDYILSTDVEELRKTIVDHLIKVRRETIAEIGMKEISYAINKHNTYASEMGIRYQFRFSVESDDIWYETMDGIGMIAFIQGIPLGNRYLNYKAYSASDLVAARKYFASKAINENESENLSYLARNLYHASNECEVYKQYKEATGQKIVPAFYYDRAEAATQGFYPCPICKP